MGLIRLFLSGSLGVAGVASRARQGRRRAAFRSLDRLKCGESSTLDPSERDVQPW